ncbi:hypothetical protein M8C21_033191 [Ambrosia artemisiifolia]|uniref:Uncharacterized protein n=1 Tax=Ambrosia artemisiifolia TaxID=4212 RepID=A0AAD5GBI7_AMBAR|nr:hypothetical protein M8C21_033191 [Ambrosia artemisiifolia]
MVMLSFSSLRKSNNTLISILKKKKKLRDYYHGSRKSGAN